MKSDDILSVDKFNLDEEWENQPKLYLKHALKLDAARKELEEAKAEFDLTRAEVDRDIRDDPEKYGLAKVTEGAIAGCILGTDEYQDALKILNAAKNKVNVLQSVVVALDHRKKALEKLVDLEARAYFAGKIPRKAQERIDDRTEQTVMRRKKKWRRRDDNA